MVGFSLCISVLRINFITTNPVKVAFLYNISIFAYDLIIRCAGLFNKKAKEWTVGRKDIFKILARSIEHSSPVVWFHCASLGEFEQGRPVMEKWRKRYPAYKILVTFLV